LYFPDFLVIFLGGFFIEAGSNDAETDSDSLHFELNHGWTVGNNKNSSFQFKQILKNSKLTDTKYYEVKIQ
jgi:hypothetical protein